MEATTKTSSSGSVVAPLADRCGDSQAAATSAVPTIRSKLSRMAINVDERQQHVVTTTVAATKTRRATSPDRRRRQNTPTKIDIKELRSPQQSPAHAQKFVTLNSRLADDNADDNDKSAASTMALAEAERTLCSSPLPLAAAGAAAAASGRGAASVGEPIDVAVKPCKAAMFQFFM